MAIRSRSVGVLLCAAALWSSIPAFSQIAAASISAEPPLTPDQVAQFESGIRANPNDKAARLRLLRHYVSPADRLPHMLFLIETFPADRAVAAQPVDSPAIRDAWIRTTQNNPEDLSILLNAARALNRTHPADAESLLSRALDRDPSNRKIAVNLGFLHAMTLLGMNSGDAERARIELERSSNAFVVAGAGVALPNLFPRTAKARSPENAPPVFEFAARLMARARELSPDNAELRGPMPLIADFQEFQQVEAPVIVREREAPPGAIRIAPEVQASKLIEKPEPEYPPLAQQARIQGRVRMDVLIAEDGHVENITLLAGHPLLVPAALEAVKRYRYQPTLLNGAAVKVVSQVEVVLTMTQWR